MDLQNELRAYQEQVKLEMKDGWAKSFHQWKSVERNQNLSEAEINKAMDLINKQAKDVSLLKRCVRANTQSGMSYYQCPIVDHSGFDSYSPLHAAVERLGTVNGFPLSYRQYQVSSETARFHHVVFLDVGSGLKSMI